MAGNSPKCDGADAGKRITVTLTVMIRTLSWSTLASRSPCLRAYCTSLRKLRRHQADHLLYPRLVAKLAQRPQLMTVEGDDWTIYLC